MLDKKDIVHRLRDTEHDGYGCGLAGDVDYCNEAFCWCRLNLEAASEIERLRERIAELEVEAEIAKHSGGFGI